MPVLILLGPQRTILVLQKFQQAHARVRLMLKTPVIRSWRDQDQEQI